MASNEPLGFISLNANGLGNPKILTGLIRWLNKFHNAASKIIYLQETHSIKKNEARWRKEWNNREIIFSHGSSGSKGVAIILPKTIDWEKNSIICSQNGRYVSVKIIVGDKTFYLINCYAPNTTKVKDQLQWLSEIQEILLENREENIIIGGDFNDVFIPALDRYRCKPNTRETEYIKA